MGGPHCLAALVLLAAGPWRYIIGFQGPDLRHRDDEIATLLTQVGGTLVRRLPFAVVVDVGDCEEPAQVVARLGGPLRGMRMPIFVAREERIRVRLRAQPNDPLYPDQWHLHPGAQAAPETAINVESAWELSSGALPGGGGVLVAVVDDGFDLTHEDLEERFWPQGLDLSGEEPDDNPSLGARDPHGTQTAGVIAATGDNAVGVIGVCPDCELLGVRLLGDGGPADLYDLDSTVAAEALVWAVDQGAAVVNNSWGPPDANPHATGPSTLQLLPVALEEALRYAAQCGRRPPGTDCQASPGLGTVVTWAAGNGAELATYDRYASDPRVLAVGAVDAAGRLAFYSDFGPTVGLVAPSSGDLGLPKIWTTDASDVAGVSPGDYTDSFAGTSAAAAMVAGAAALVLGRYPELTAAQVHEALLESAFKIDPVRARYDTTTGRSLFYGHGRVDVAAALTLSASYVDACTHHLEMCGNGRDDNCDGLSDQEDPRCHACVPTPEGVEVCDGQDNNCDGLIDELFVCEETGRPFCAPCTLSKQCDDGLRCRPAGAFKGSWCFQDCLQGQVCPQGTMCNGEVCLLTVSQEVRDCLDVLYCNTPERCDGHDNDCNDAIDDIAPDATDAQRAREACGTLGVCGQGSIACEEGRWRCVRADAWQEEERSCDGLDNDCDGAVDEPPQCSKGALRGGGGCQTHGSPGAVALLLLLVLNALGAACRSPTGHPR